MRRIVGDIIVGLKLLDDTAGSLDMQTRGNTAFLIVGLNDKFLFTGPYGDGLDVQCVFGVRGRRRRDWQRQMVHDNHCEDMQ
jgi:hypothetical protein